MTPLPRLKTLRPLFFVAALFLAALGQYSAVAQETNPDTAPEPETIPYEVTFSGIEDESLLTRLQNLSECVSLQNDGVNTPLHLRRRMNRDVDTFAGLLRSEGYYWHIIEPTVNEEAEPIAANFTIQLKKRCRFGVISIKATDPVHAAPLAEIPLGELKSAEPARAATVRAAESQILATLQQIGYPFPTIADRETVVDSETRTMDVTLIVDTGPNATFGDISVTGLDHIKESVVTIERPWSQGDVYDLRKVELYRKRLYDTNLFTVVQVQPLDDVKDNQVPIAIELAERNQRTISLGANYYSDVGAGVIVKWQHRNLWGEGRQIDIESQFSQQIQSLGARLTLKNFNQRLQDLQFSVLGASEDVEAYKSDHVGGRVWLTRRLPIKYMAAGAGLAVRFTDIEQFGESNTYQLFSIPTELSWDNSDDLLDPTKGFRMRAQVEPFIDLGGESSEFVKAQVAASYYLSLDETSKFILASRFKLGSLGGASTENLPPDERFYSGGGGSVRGYPYQSLGPRFKGDPFGGSSVLETSVEIRYRISETIGAVAFVDGGSAFESEYPDFKEDLRWGAGLGLRYYSPIGPFRFDLALPVNKPDHVDESFQVYLSIGQAF